MTYNELSKKNGVGLHHGAKSLLRNTIRHTDTHNRLLEEAEMWQTYYRMKGEGSSIADDTDLSMDRRKRERRAIVGVSDPQIENSFLYDDRRAVATDRRREDRFTRRAHMDDDGSISAYGANEKGSAITGSTYWQRQLLKEEEKDEDRWGHGGFKELYPQDFESDRSENEGKSSKDKTKTKKIEKRQKMKKRKKSKSRQSGDQTHRKRKRKKKSKHDGDGDDDDRSDRKKTKVRKIQSMPVRNSDNDDRTRRKSRKEKASKDFPNLDSRESAGSKRKRTWREDRNERETDSETSDSSFVGTVRDGSDSTGTDGSDSDHRNNTAKHCMLATKQSSSRNESLSPRSSEDGKGKAEGLAVHKYRRKEKRRKRVHGDTNSGDCQKSVSNGEPSHRKKKRRKE